MSTIKYLNFEGLKRFKELIINYIDSLFNKSLKSEIVSQEEYDKKDTKDSTTMYLIKQDNLLVKIYIGELEYDPLHTMWEER